MKRRSLKTTHPVIVGWFVALRITGSIRKTGIVGYANGAGAWVPERRRAFVFTTTPGADHGDVRQNRGGRAWAQNHADHMRKTTKPPKGRRVAVFIIRRKAMP